jgi:DNA-binding GntR family transcriptional regulator
MAKSPPPKVTAAAGEIRGMIASGRLRPGEQVPTRAELAEATGACGAYVAQALRLLVKEGALRAPDPPGGGRRATVPYPPGHPGAGGP